jgi:hypothetical protein
MGDHQFHQDVHGGAAQLLQTGGHAQEPGDKLASTSGWARKVHSAEKFFSRARQVTSVLASGVVSPGLTPRSTAHSSLAPNAWRMPVAAASNARRLMPPSCQAYQGIPAQAMHENHIHLPAVQRALGNQMERGHLVLGWAERGERL